MGLMDYLITIITTPSVAIFGALTLIEITPIKINPWKSLLKWIGNTINLDLKNQVNAMEKDLKELKVDCEKQNVANMRWEILNYTNSCRRGIHHSKDEWQHLLDQLSRYEAYTEEKGIINGVIDEDAKYLRTLYSECNKNNNFF